MDEKAKIPTPVISLIPLFVLSHCWLWLSLSSVEMCTWEGHIASD